MVIHYRREAPRPGRETLTGMLRQEGFGRVEWRAVPGTVSRSQTRYFHASDRGLSDRALAALRGVGRSAVPRDFTHYTPSPRVGTVEIWLGD